MISYPISAKRNEGSSYLHLIDSSGRIIAGCILADDAEEIVAAMNEYRGGKVRRKKEKIEETLRRSDLTGQLAQRDNIEYGPHDSLPGGMHVTNLRREP